MDSVLVINNVTHGMQIAGVVTSVFGGIIIYNIIRIFMGLKQQAKVTEAVDMIKDGHQRFLNEKTDIIVDGERLGESFMKDKVEKADAKLAKKNKTDKTESKAKIGQSKIGGIRHKKGTVSLKDQMLSLDDVLIKLDYADRLLNCVDPTNYLVSDNQDVQNRINELIAEKKAKDEKENTMTKIKQKQTESKESKKRIHKATRNINADDINLFDNEISERKSNKKHREAAG